MLKKEYSKRITTFFTGADHIMVRISKRSRGTCLNWIIFVIRLVIYNSHNDLASLLINKVYTKTSVKIDKQAFDII